MPFSTLPAGTCPGQRRRAGQRKPPSNAVPFPPTNGVCPPSGQENFSVPLSVVKTTMVLSSTPSPSASALSHRRCRPVAPSQLRRKVCDDVHSRGVEPQEERLSGTMSLVDERQCVRQYLVVYSFHSLRAKLSRILNLLLANFPATWLDGGIVNVSAPSVDHVARPDGVL